MKKLLKTLFFVTPLVLLFFSVVSQMVVGSRLDYASIMVNMIEEKRLEALNGTIEDAAYALAKAEGIWPPRTPELSKAGQMFKTVRNWAVRDIIQRMRELSGEDLGDDPQAWLDEYFPRIAEAKDANSYSSHDQTPHENPSQQQNNE